MKNLNIKSNEKLTHFFYEGEFGQPLGAFIYKYFKNDLEICSFIVKSLENGRNRRDEYLIKENEQIKPTSAAGRP